MSRGTVPVKIRGLAKGPRYELFAAGGDEPMASCGSCFVHVPPGRYRVRVSETADTAAGERKVRIEGPSIVTIEPRSSSDRGMGLGMAVTGSVASLAGVVLILQGIPAASCRVENCEPDDFPFIPVGSVLLITGAILMPVGWVTFGKSFRPGVKVERYDSGHDAARDSREARSNRRRVTLPIALGAARVDRGFVGGAAVRF